MKICRNIFISIHPGYADKIIAGKKTIELRRKFPSLDEACGRLIIYATQPLQAVIGYAEIKEVHHLPIKKIWQSFGDSAQVDKEDFLKYFSGLDYGYAIQLKKPKRFSRAIPISYLKENYGITPPQSYRYWNEDIESLLEYAKVGH